MARYVPVFRGTVVSGKFVMDKPDEYSMWLAHMEGKTVYCHFKLQSKPKSSAQQGYYWGVVLKVISDYTGHETDELHEIFKNKFLREDDNSAIGYRIKSTSTLSAAEMCEYMSRVITWASVEIGCYIPSPEEMQKI